MRLFPLSSELRFAALAVTSSNEICDALARSVAETKLRLRRQVTVADAMAAAERESIPVIVVATDVNWRELLMSCRTDAAPSVIVLMPGSDAALWAEAMNLGAFDALSMSVDPGQLLWALSQAFQRWERRQLVRDAVSQNPLVKAS